MRKAFTILELLAATALTALLTVAVLHVVSSLGRSRAALARQSDDGAWQADLLDTLRRDLTNASQAQFRPDGITLIAHGSLDATTVAPGDELVTIVYGVVPIHGRPWLVRRQTSRNGAAGDAGWSELLCPNVAAFSVAPALAVIPGRGTPPPASDTFDAVPAIVSVRLQGVSGTVVNEKLVLR